MGISEFIQAYKEFGVAALFICMYLMTIRWFVRDLKVQRKEAREDRDKMISALEAAKKSIDDSTRVMTEVKHTSDATRFQIAEFISFLRGINEGNKR